MTQSTTDGGNESDDHERDIEVGDRVQAGDLVAGDVVTPTADDETHYDVVEIWREEDSNIDPLRVKLQDGDGNEEVVVGTVSRHYLVEHASPSDENDPTADGGEDVETETDNLRVDPDTVIAGLNINSKPGEQRRVLFHKNMHGEYGSGTLRDVRGLMWDGEGPIQLRPQQFLSEDVGSPAEAKAGARRIAEEEGDDPEEAAEVAYENWEGQARNWLQEEIVVEARFPEETTTVYSIEYVSDDE